MEMNGLRNQAPTRIQPYFFSIALLSGSIIAYEISLVRLFSITQWHHFAHMVISLALLGFGASGTALSIAQRWLTRRFQAAYTISGLVYAVSVVGCFALSQRIPFNPLMLVWQPGQMRFVLLLYLLLSIPFFFGAACIGLALLRFTENVDRLYFFDLLGSGAGALGVIFAMYWIPPTQYLTLIAAAGFCGVLIANFNRRRWAMGVAPAAAAFIAWLAFHPISLKISPYKGLPSMLNFPDAEILSERHSPLGVLHVVRSQSIHAAPGLSLASQRSSPEQLGLFTDADAMTAITRFDGDLAKLAYLGDAAAALAYHLTRAPRVLVLGAGGGGDVLSALHHGAAAIDAVELNPQVVELVEREHGDFAGRIYSESSPYPIRVHIAEARGFIRATPNRYDLIQISLLDSVGASAAGTHALSESYLYTVEAIAEMFQRLTPGGVISITRWLKTPPRDMLRLFATAVEALERLDGQTPAQQLALIRGWQTGTLLVKNGRFNPEDCAVIRRFCQERSFDTAYYPGMPESEANRYNQLAEPVYFRAAQTILSDGREQFYRRYPFDVRPTTDDRPYFFQFLRFVSLFEMMQTLGRSAIPFVEWGYLLLIATLIQAVVAAGVLILPPLIFLKRGRTREPQPRARQVFGYFLCLGVGFMFIEMAFIQKFLLLLAHPTYAVSVVLCAFLIFAGLGSFFSRRMAEAARRLSPQWGHAIPIAIGLLSLIALLYLWMLPLIFRFFLASPDPIKIIASIGLIAPLAFFMGMPFPLGVKQLHRSDPALIAWAWGINGYASVVSAILATCLSIAFGFNVVILAAVLIYLLGAVLGLSLTQAYGWD